MNDDSVGDSDEYVDNVMEMVMLMIVMVMMIMMIIFLIYKNCRKICSDYGEDNVSDYNINDSVLW